MGETTQNNSQSKCTTNNTRFEVISALIKSITTGGSSETVKGWLTHISFDDTIEIWDGLRNIMKDQGVIGADAQVLQIKKRNTKSTKNGMQISPLQTYKDEIASWTNLAKPINVKEYDDKYDIYFKACTINMTAINNKIKDKKLEKNSANTQGSSQPYQKQQVPPRHQQQPQQQIANSDSTNLRLDNIMNLITDNGKFMKEIQADVAKVKATAETNQGLGQKVTTQIADLETKWDQKFQDLETKITNNERRLLDLENKEYPGVNFENIRGEVNNMIREAIAEQVNPAAAEGHANQPEQNRVRRNFIWGQAQDRREDTRIERKYAFAVGRVPKQHRYSVEWLRNALETNFNVVGIDATIDTVEPIESRFEGAKTKSFKVLIKKGTDATEESLKNPQLWVENTLVSKYRRPRDNNDRENGNGLNRRNGFRGNNNDFGRYPGREHEG